MPNSSTSSSSSSTDSENTTFVTMTADEFLAISSDESLVTAYAYAESDTMVTITYEGVNVAVVTFISDATASILTEIVTTHCTLDSDGAIDFSTYGNTEVYVYARSIDTSDLSVTEWRIIMGDTLVTRVDTLETTAESHDSRITALEEQETDTTDYATTDYVDETVDTVASQLTDLSETVASQLTYKTFQSIISSDTNCTIYNSDTEYTGVVVFLESTGLFYLCTDTSLMILYSGWDGDENFLSDGSVRTDVLYVCADDSCIYCYDSDTNALVCLSGASQSDITDAVDAATTSITETVTTLIEDTTETITATTETAIANAIAAITDFRIAFFQQVLPDGWTTSIAENTDYSSLTTGGIIYDTTSAEFVWCKSTLPLDEPDEDAATKDTILATYSYWATSSMFRDDDGKPLSDYLYVDENANIVYRWDGSKLVALSISADDLADAVTSVTESYTEAIASSVEEINTLIASLASADDLTTLSETVSTISSTLEDLQTAVSEAATLISTNEEAVSTLSSTVSSLQESLLSAVSSISETASSVTTLTSTLSTSISEINTSLEDYVTLKQLQDTQESIEDQITALSETVSSLSSSISDITDYSSEISALEESVSSLESAVATNTTNITTLATDTSTLGSSIEEIQEAYTALVEAIMANSSYANLLTAIESSEVIQKTFTSLEIASSDLLQQAE